MPCSGPNCDHVRRHASVITNEVLGFLCEKHCMGSGSLDKPNDRFSFREELKAKLLAVIEEIAVDDACMSW